MGDCAEMMLGGSLCAGYGSFLGDFAGYPLFCSTDCAADHGQAKRQPKRKLPASKIKPPAAVPCTCGVCGRSFGSKGARRAHCRDKHTVSK